MVTINDVAKELGVSRSTVSYALSGKRPISAEMKERVHAVIREMEFWPSAAGRALATSSSRIIALLAPMAANATHEVALQFIYGVVQASRASGYDILLVTDDEAFHCVQRLVRARQVDGFIVLDVAEFDPRTVALEEAGAFATLIGMPDGGHGLDRIDVDWAGAGSLLVTHLVDLGHRSLCLLGAPEAAHQLGMTYALRFGTGARGAAVKARVRWLEMATGHDFLQTAQEVEMVLAKHPEVTAFVVQHEAAVAPLLSALNRMGGQVPGDYSVAGISMDKLGPNFAPPVSGVRNPSVDITRAAVTLLLDRLEHPDREPQSLLIAPEYVDHETTAAPRTDEQESTESYEDTRLADVDTWSAFIGKKRRKDKYEVY